MRKLSFVLAVGGAMATVGLGATAMPASGVSPAPVQAVTTGTATVQPVQYYRRPPYHRHYHCYYRHGRRYCR